MMSGSVENAWAQWRDLNIYLDRDQLDSKMIAFKAGYALAINNKFSFAGWRWRPFGGCWTFANSEEEATSLAKKYNGVCEPLYYLLPERDANARTDRGRVSQMTEQRVSKASIDFFFRNGRQEFAGHPSFYDLYFDLRNSRAREAILRANQNNTLVNNVANEADNVDLVDVMARLMCEHDECRWYGGFEGEKSRYRIAVRHALRLRETALREMRPSGHQPLTTER